MTPTPAVMPNGKVNRFQTFHHHRKTNPAFYTRFETAVFHILKRAETPLVVNTRVLRDTLNRDFPTLAWTVDGIDVFKAMLSWFRYNNPQFVNRFRFRKTEVGRKPKTGRDWAGESQKNVKGETLIKLVNYLREHPVPTTMTLLKQGANVTFNQNYNAEVADYIRTNWSSLAHLLPAKRRRVR